MQLRLAVPNRTLAATARPQRATKSRFVIQANTLWQLQPGRPLREPAECSGGYRRGRRRRGRMGFIVGRGAALSPAQQQTVKPRPCCPPALQTPSGARPTLSCARRCRRWAGFGAVGSCYSCDRCSSRVGQVCVARCTLSAAD